METENTTTESDGSIAEAENNLKATIQSLRQGSDETTETETEAEERPAGSERVEIADPEVKQRVDWLYGRWRYAEEQNQALINHQKELDEALDKLIQKENRREQSQSLDLLRKQKQEARANGDEEALDRIDEQITNFVAEQKLQELKPKAPVNPPPAQPQQPQLNPKDVQYVEFLKTERDTVGNVKRPYLHAWHPDFNRAVERAAEVTNTLQQQGKPHTLDIVMKEVDRFMGSSRQAPTQAEVLSGGGNLTTPLGNKKIGLTEADKQIARKLGFKKEDLDGFAKRKAKINYARAISVEDFE